MRRDERGAGTVFALMWVGVLVTLGMASVLAVGVVTTHRRSQAAADLSALAGAQAHQRGADGCAAAGSVAARNGARLASCRLVGRDLLVTVSMPAPGVLGEGSAGLSLRARARAGPAGWPGGVPAR